MTSGGRAEISVAGNDGPILTMLLDRETLGILELEDDAPVYSFSVHSFYVYIVC